MREQGVPDKVIDYMQQTYVEAVRSLGRARQRDAYLFAPFPGYPFRPYGALPFWVVTPANNILIYLVNPQKLDDD